MSGTRKKKVKNLTIFMRVAISYKGLNHIRRFKRGHIDPLSSI